MWIVIRHMKEVCCVWFEPPEPLSDRGKVMWNGGPGYMPAALSDLEVLKTYPNSRDDDPWVAFCQEFPKQPTTSHEQHEYWMSPTGQLYACRYGDHDGLAEHLAAQFYGITRRCVDAIEERGWVRIHSTGPGWSPNHHYTQAQLDTMFDLSQTGDPTWRKAFEQELKQCADS